jgi:hypothetical protein
MSANASEFTNKTDSAAKRNFRENRFILLLEIKNEVAVEYRESTHAIKDYCFAMEAEQQFLLGVVRFT